MNDPTSDETNVAKTWKLTHVFSRRIPKAINQIPGFVPLMCSFILSKIKCHPCGRAIL